MQIREGHLPTYIQALLYWPDRKQAEVHGPPKITLNLSFPVRWESVLIRFLRGFQVSRKISEY